MSDTPLGDAVKRIPHNELELEAGATEKDGAEARARFERDFGERSVGAEGELSQKSGWRVMGFYRRIWGSKT